MHRYGVKRSCAPASYLPLALMALAGCISVERSPPPTTTVVAPAPAPAPPVTTETTTIRRSGPYLTDPGLTDAGRGDAGTR